jgi:hypothetical protein
MFYILTKLPMIVHTFSEYTGTISLKQRCSNTNFVSSNLKAKIAFWFQNNLKHKFMRIAQIFITTALQLHFVH